MKIFLEKNFFKQYLMKFSEICLVTRMERNIFHLNYQLTKVSHAKFNFEFGQLLGFLKVNHNFVKKFLRFFFER